MNKVSNDKSVISKKKNYSTLNNFVSGGLALASSFTLMHPLDTARVHLQHSNTNTLQLNNFRKMFRFYSRGFMPSVLLSMPQGGIRLSTYEESKKKLNPYINPVLCSATCAVIGDIASSVIKMPREVITQRIQTNMCKNTSEVISDILRRRKLTEFFRGTTSTVMRDIPFMVTLFTCYDKLKLERAKLMRNNDDISTMEFTLMGGASGFIAGLATTPFDVIKTRIVTNAEKQDISTTMIKLLKENKIKSFFRGGLVRSTWWFGVCSLFFPIYENLRMRNSNYF